MAGGLLILSWDFTHLFLTDKWIAIVPVIQILCLSAMIGSITTPAGIMFQAVGRPSIGTKIAAAGVIFCNYYLSFIFKMGNNWYGCVNSFKHLDYPVG